MPLILYCVTESEAVIQTSSPGVAGSVLECIEEARLRCFVSRNCGTDSIMGPAIQESAMAFHRVIGDIFRQASVIPFRFPTLLENKEQVKAHLREHAAEYHEAFERLQHRVQMEIRISYCGEKGGEHSRQTSSSGAEYLRARHARQKQLESAAERFRGAANSLLRGWQQWAWADQIRCFALLDEDSVVNFRRELRGVPLASDLRARISGPWPPSEFLKEQ